MGRLLKSARNLIGLRESPQVIQHGAALGDVDAFCGLVACELRRCCANRVAASPEDVGRKKLTRHQHARACPVLFGNPWNPPAPRKGESIGTTPNRAKVTSSHSGRCLDHHGTRGPAWRAGRRRWRHGHLGGLSGAEGGAAARLDARSGGVATVHCMRASKPPLSCGRGDVKVSWASCLAAMVATMDRPSP